MTLDDHAGHNHGPVVREPDPHAGHDHDPDQPCEGCWMTEYRLRDDGTWGIHVKHGPEYQHFVLESYPWPSMEEAQSRAKFIMSELDAAIVTGTEVPQESIEFFKIHLPINYPNPR